MGILENLTLAGTPHVAVDQQHLFAGHGAGNGQVGRNRGFAFAGDGAGDHDRMRILAHQRIKKVHAQLRVAFDVLHRAVVAQHEGHRVFIVLFPPPYRGQHRHVIAVSQFLGVCDLAVEQEQQHQHGGRQRAAYQGSFHGTANRIAAVGPGGRHGIVDDLHAARADDPDDLRRSHVHHGVADVCGHLRIPGSAAHLQHACFRNRAHRQ